MTTAMQAALFGERPSSTTDPNKVLIPRTRLLAFADACEANNEKWKASAIRTACAHVWGDDGVAVSRSLVRMWGMEEDAA